MEPLIDLSLVRALIEAGALKPNDVGEIRIRVWALDFDADDGNGFGEVEFTMLKRDHTDAVVIDEVTNKVATYIVTRSINL